MYLYFTPFNFPSWEMTSSITKYFSPGIPMSERDMKPSSSHRAMAHARHLCQYALSYHLPAEDGGIPVLAGGVAEPYAFDDRLHIVYGGPSPLLHAYHGLRYLISGKPGMSGKLFPYGTETFEVPYLYLSGLLSWHGQSNLVSNCAFFIRSSRSKLAR